MPITRMCDHRQYAQVDLRHTLIDMRASFATVILLVSVSPLVAQMTLSGERANNTSAADTFRGNTDGCGGRSPGNPAAGNVSKLPTRSLLYAGAATKLYAHLLPWFCMNAKRDADNVVRCNGHVLTGYDSNDPEQVRRQVEDMISRGLDGVIIDWYGSSAAIEEETTQYVKAEAERHPGFELAIMEDKGAFSAAPDKVAKLIEDLNYVADHYYGSPAYMRRNGRPVLFFFVDPSELRAEEWAAVRAAIHGNPLFIFQDRGDDGAFAWIGLNDHPFCDYLHNFYRSVPAGKEIFGSAYQGFDDTLANWSGGRKLDRRCGQTWLCSFESANDAFDAAHPLANLQLVTWNDYDEGTEIETGIDNCLALSASIDGGHHLHWVPHWTSAHGTEATIDRYRIFSSTDGEHLTLRAERPAGTRSVDLETLGLSGTQKLFVQAVGKPSILNHIVDAGTFSARAVAVTASSSVTISNPSQCAAVSSPIHVIADETSAATAGAMQIYLDGMLVTDRQGVEHLDEFVDAAPGPHQLAVKAWYGLTPGDPVFVDVVVAPTVVIASPAPNATLLSPIPVVADETTPAMATVMQIYLDGTFVLERPGEHLDELVTADSGAHQIAVKAWYPSCPGEPVAVDVTVAPPGPPLVIPIPTPNAVVSAPIHVVADENTLATATAMQIDLDEVLVVDVPNTEHLDELIAASVGYHQIEVKSWYADATSSTARVNVLVDSEGPGAPIVIDSPAACATVQSPIHLIAHESTTDVAVVMQVYLDGVLIADRHDIEHLDELIPASPGTHWLVVKAWYAGERTQLVEAYFTVTESRRRAAHAR